MEPTIGPVAADQREAFERGKALAFGQRFDPERSAASRAVQETDRMVAGFDGDQIVATGLSYTFRISVPGTALEVATAGIGGITVLPTHRRRGLLRRLMRHLLDDAHGRGEPLSLLWASEATIYPRFGFGQATTGLRWEIEREATAFAPGVAVPPRPVRLLDCGQEKVIETIAPVHDRVRRSRPGMIGRSPAWWRRHTQDHDQDLLFVVTGGDEGVDGYVAYTVAGAWGPLGPDNKLAVREAMASTPGAEMRLWRYIFDVDLVTTVSAWGRPPDEALPFMLADPRRLRRSVGEGAWLRLVDVGAALAARCYGSELRLVFEVVDEFCPWNSGRWLLEAGPEGAACRRTDALPDIMCGVAELGSAYLGDTSMDALRRAGRLVELTPGATRSADRGLLWEPRPWAVTWF